MTAKAPNMMLFVLMSARMVYLYHHGGLVMVNEVFRDAKGNPHEFKFTSRDTPSGLSMRAVELRDGEPRGYEFAVLGEDDEETLKQRLAKKIERALLQRHMEYQELANTWCPMGQTLHGRISYDRSADAPLIVIDGQEITWEQFAKTMLVQEGFQFRLTFVDITEEM